MKQPCNTYAGCCQMTNAMCQAQCWREAGGGGQKQKRTQNNYEKAVQQLVSLLLSVSKVPRPTQAGSTLCIGAIKALQFAGTICNADGRARGMTSLLHKPRRRKEERMKKKNNY